MDEKSWYLAIGFLCSSVGKESAYNAGDSGSIPGLGRSPGEGNGNPRQSSCLDYPMDCSLPGSSVHGIARVGHDLATKPPPPHRIEERWCCVAWGNGSVVVTTRNENEMPAFSTLQGKGIERHQVSLLFFETFTVHLFS